MEDKIIIKGAREHNLKNIDVEFPRNKMVVFTGLSGSGKSSLAFDTIFAEGQRRYVESLSAYARQFLGQMPKPDVDEIRGLSPAISIDQKAHSSNPRSTVATITEIYDYLRVLFARVGIPHCVVCGKIIQKMTTDEIITSVMKKISDTTETGKLITVLAPVVSGRKGEYHQLLYDLYNAGFSKVRVDGKIKALKNRLVLSRYEQHTIELIVDELSALVLAKGMVGDRTRLAEAIEMGMARSEGTVTVAFPDKTEVLYSSQFSCVEHNFAFPELSPRLFSFNSPQGYCEACTGLGTEELFSEKVCAVCEGKRLRKESLAVTVGEKNIVEVTALSVAQAIDFFMELVPGNKELDSRLRGNDTVGRDDKKEMVVDKKKEKDDKKKMVNQKETLNETEYAIAHNVLREIIDRLTFMQDVGLHYLTLDRRAGTLSGGEAQRIRLASQIGSKLTGTLYVLDEPTIGLHQHDNERLVKTLKDLRDIGNTIVVVEHDEDTILASDYLIDFGPGAGKHGGQVVVAGETQKLLKSPNTSKSLTLDYLQGTKKIAIPKRRRTDNLDTIKIHGATEHNLKNINVEIPLRRMVCVTGVSGSGKSTLVHDIVYQTIANRLNHTRKLTGKVKSVLGTEYLEKIILMDQSAIGRTPRSNPATYTGIFSHMRDMFAMTADARMRGYKAGRFSFNVPRERGGGRCEHCEGHGQIAIEMHFLPTVYVPCDVCKGKRFDAETLSVHYKGKNIFDVLAMTVEEGRAFYEDVPVIHDALKVMSEVGLDYIELGQAATTLSGGEAQRVKLACELSKRGNAKTLYILDEPTVGLHYEDVRKLIEVLQRLVDRGSTVLIIEHNLDVIKCADYIIDLGHEGGDAGGSVVAVGTPEEVARKAGSFTGKYLKKILK